MYPGLHPPSWRGTLRRGAGEAVGDHRAAAGAARATSVADRDPWWSRSGLVAHRTEAVVEIQGPDARAPAHRAEHPAAAPPDPRGHIALLTGELRDDTGDRLTPPTPPRRGDSIATMSPVLCSLDRSRTRRRSGAGGLDRLAPAGPGAGGGGRSHGGRAPKRSGGAASGNSIPMRDGRLCGCGRHAPRGAADGAIPRGVAAADRLGDHPIGAAVAPTRSGSPRERAWGIA